MMSRKAALLALFALVCGWLAGCATNQSVPELPTSLSREGVLVARINVLSMQAMENARINVDGVLRSASLRDGYIAISLPPGEHELVQIRAEGQLLGSAPQVEVSPVRLAKTYAPVPIYTYVPGNSYVIHYTTLSVGRKFRIEEGKITNLGLMVYVPAKEDAEKKTTASKQREFNVVTLANNAETSAFMEANYPELMRSLTDRTISMAPAKYFDAELLPQLRRIIAYYENSNKHVLTTAKETFIYGRAGTVVALSANPLDGKPNVEVLDTGTLADVVGATEQGGRAAFMTADAKLFSWKDGKLSSTLLPFKSQIVRMRALGDDGLVAVDNRMRVFTSQAPGAAWSAFEGALTKYPRNDIAMESDGDGVYLAAGNQGVPEGVSYLRAGEGTPVALPVPANTGAISSSDRRFFVAREAGLFVLYDRPNFYFWSKATRSWALHAQPAGKCQPMKIEGQGRRLTIDCDNVHYTSDDSGATWAKPSV